MGGPFPVADAQNELLDILRSLSVERAVGDETPFCFFQKDRDGRLLWVNDQYCRFIGKTATEIVGRTDFDILPAVFAQKYRDDDLRIMADGRSFRTFESIRASDGSHCLIYVVKVPHRDDAGRIVGVLGAFWDSPPRSEVEDRLRESEERLRGVIDAMPVMLSALDRQGRVGFWNRECERITGYAAGEIVGRPDGLSKLYPDEDYLREMMGRWNRGEAPLRDWEWTLTCKDGTRKTVAWTNVREVIHHSGWASLALGVDVTEKKQALDIVHAIREVQSDYIAGRAPDELFEKLLRRMLEVTASAHGFIADVVKRPAGPRRLKIRAAVGNDWVEKDLDNPATLVGAVLSSGRPVFANDLPGDTPLRSFLGVPLYHSGRMIGMAGVANRPAGADAAVLESIEPLLATCALLLDSCRAEDERHRQEDERRRLEAQLQYSQKLESLGVLAGGIAHDFNNLLVSVLGHASLALQDVEPLSPARESIHHIETAAMRAADLCKQMLAYSGKGRFVIHRINLTDLVEEMAHLLQVSISKKIVLRYNLVRNVPVVEADASQLRQVVMNLITNASEACGDASGQISISTGVMDVDREYLTTTYIDEGLGAGRYVYVEVSDTGCGMDEPTQARIFDPFFTTKAAGRGLGMAAVLGIVRGHRGAIKCYSEIGRGTTFKVLFPAVAGESDRTPESTSIPAPPGSGMVLVVDDEEGVRTLAQRVLERQGFKVLVAKDGREGVDIYRLFKDEIVLVLLDMTMPRLSGEEAFRELRLIRDDVRVILSSGYNELEATNRFVGKGLAGFIQKPYRPSALLEIVNRVLAGERAPTERGGS